MLRKPQSSPVPMCFYFLPESERGAVSAFIRIAVGNGQLAARRARMLTDCFRAAGPKMCIALHDVEEV
eukprot:16195298-Heterocapsa_arctica.AAC.1